MVGRQALMPPTVALRNALHAVRRHIWLIAFSIVCLNATAAFVVMKLPRRYTAEASVLIGPREAQVMDVKAVIAGLSGEDDVLESEVQVLRSRELARSVIVALKLDRNPEFNTTLAPPAFRARVAAQIQTWLQLLPASLRPAPPPATLIEAQKRADAARDPLSHVTDRLLNSLSVAEKGHSRVIGIAFTSADPVVAANVANAFAEAYIAEQLQEKTDATTHAHQWLEQRVAELHKQVIAADTAVESYRQQIGLLQGRTSSLMTEQISEIGQQIVQAQVARATAEARLQTVTAALASPEGINGLPEVEQSMVVRDLRAEESSAARQAAELSQTLGSGHPRVAAVRAQVDAIRSRIRQEVERIASGLRDDVQTATARETLLEQTLSTLRRQVGVGKEGEIELRSLQHEADADQALYDRVLARAKETQVESGLQQPDAKMISRAEPPDSPSFPNPSVMLPVLFIASSLMTALLVFAVESLDHGFSSPDQVERALGLPTLGIVPRLPRRQSRRSPAAYVLANPESLYGEAVRSLYTGILLSGASRPPKVVLFTSANPHEGKTSIVLSLARMMASCGKRVAIVDCDIRQPTLHRDLGLDRGPGLVDCLNSGADVFATMVRDPFSPAWLLPAGSPGQIPPAIFASEAMRKLIGALAERFDLVLLDSAPVLLVSDTRALTRLADKTVLVVKWQATRRMHVAPALRQMIDARGDVAGVLLSMVDFGRYGRSGDGGLSRRHLRLYFAK